MKPAFFVVMGRLLAFLSVFISGFCAAQSAITISPVAIGNKQPPTFVIEGANSLLLPISALSHSGSPSLVAAPVVLKWEVQVADITYATTFRRWGIATGYRVRWDAYRHVLVDGPDVLVGSFEAAIEQILSSPSISNSDYPLEVCFYPNTPPLARVTRRGEQTNDCK